MVEVLQQISVIMLEFFFLPIYLLISFYNSKVLKPKGYSKREDLFLPVAFLIGIALTILWIKLIHFSITTLGGIKALSSTTIITTLIILPSAFLIISFFWGGKTEKKDGDYDD